MSSQHTKNTLQSGDHTSLKLSLLSLEPIARGLTYRDGDLYYFCEPDYNTVQIEAQPVAGGEPRLVTRVGMGGSMWLMGDGEKWL